MQEKMEQSKEAREQYLKEKDQVDGLVQKILNEDKQFAILNSISLLKMF